MSVDEFLAPRDVRYARGELSPEGYYRDSFDLSALVAEATAAFEAGQAALRANDFAAYGQAQERLRVALDRLPDVDRAILRMAVFELLWADDVPDAVVIDEAVELAKVLSTDDSPAYVNGVLGGIVRAEIPTQ